MQIFKSPNNMVKKCSLFLLGLFAVIQISTAQVVVKISDGTVDAGGTVDVDVVFDNFADIISFQHSINWDSTKFSFNSIINVTTALDQFTAGLINTPASTTDPGVLQISWSKTNTQPETLPNGTRIFTLRLNAIGNACDTDVVRVSNDPIPVEFANSATENVGVDPDNGTLTINGTGCNSGGGDLVVTVGNVTANIGENRCIPITVENFINLQTVGFGLEWDPSIIEYTGVQNASLPDFSGANIGNTNIAEGKLTVLWFDNSGVTPLSLEGVLLEVCFDGRSGGVSDVDIVNPDGNGGGIDFTNSDEVAVPFTLVNGTFTVEGVGNPDDFMLIAPDVNIDMGGSACIPISVVNFDDIQTMQFDIRWDPAMFAYSDVQSINLQSLVAENFTTKGDDRLRISWNDPNGVTIADNTVIFELCLVGNGDCDESSAIRFTDDPANFFNIEVSNSDNQLVTVSPTSGSATVICDGCNIGLDELQTPSCPGDSDGNILVALPSGSFTCTWTNVSGTVIQTSTDCDLLNVAAGEYTLNIDDGADCQVSRTFTLLDPAAIVFGGSKMNEESDCDGSITLEMIGGSGEFTFSWDDGSADATRTELCAGEYCVTATDANGCTAETCFTVDPNGPSPCNEDITDNRCFGEDDGAIDIDICGGVGPYTISWSGPSGQYTTEDISGLLSGDYDYTITDSSNPALESTGSLSVGSPAEIVITSTVISSDGDQNNGSIDISVTGGVGSYSYVWTPGGQQTQDISGLAPGDYSVMVTDENNCSVVSLPAIQVMSTTINFVRSGETDVSCNGVCDGVIEGVTTGGSGNYTYRLNDSAVSFPPMGLCPGEYSFQISDDAGLSVTQTVVVGETELLSIVLENKSNCTGNAENGSIEVEAAGGNGEYEYVWSPTTGSGPMLTNLGGGTYSVLVTDRRGCTAVLADDVVIVCGDGPGDCFTGRTIITPNGDGVNDELLVMCATDFVNKILVFDRWGNTVYEMSEYDNSWAGTNSNGEELPEGGYLWVMEITRGDGIREIKQGSVTILRDQF